jgi:hypothetical protein
MPPSPRAALAVHKICFLWRCTNQRSARDDLLGSRQKCNASKHTYKSQHWRCSPAHAIVSNIGQEIWAAEEQQA